MGINFSNSYSYCLHLLFRRVPQRFYLFVAGIILHLLQLHNQYFPSKDGECDLDSLHVGYHWHHGAFIAYFQLLILLFAHRSCHRCISIAVSHIDYALGAALRWQVGHFLGSLCRILLQLDLLFKKSLHRQRPYGSGCFGWLGRTSL